jgi:hypothetical protein
MAALPVTLFKRCDSCSADLSQHDPGYEDAWIDIVVYHLGATDLPVNFCSWPCLIGYATAQAGGDRP